MKETHDTTHEKHKNFVSAGGHFSHKFSLNLFPTCWKCYVFIAVFIRLENKRYKTYFSLSL